MTKNFIIYSYTLLIGAQLHVHDCWLDADLLFSITYLFTAVAYFE